MTTPDRDIGDRSASGGRLHSRQRTPPKMTPDIKTNPSQDVKGHIRTQFAGRGWTVTCNGRYVSLDEIADALSLPQAVEPVAGELRTCPFCGAQAEFRKNTNRHKNDGEWDVVCRECPAEMRMEHTEASVAKLWNTRPLYAHPHPAAAVARVTRFTPDGSRWSYALKAHPAGDAPSQTDVDYGDDHLAPCPFCGGEAEVIDIDEGENEGGSCVSCKVCEASSNLDFGRKENFRSNWNRRASLSQPSGEDVEAIARVIDPEEWALDDLAKTKGMRALFIDRSLAKARQIAALSAQPTPIQAGGDVVGALEAADTKLAEFGVCPAMHVRASIRQALAALAVGKGE